MYTHMYAYIHIYIYTLFKCVYINIIIRQWTDYAKWTFREFNELPHQFSERMYSAQVMAEQYCSSTRPSSPVLESVWRFVKFVAGSILAVLLIVALWDDTPLLFVKIQEMLR